ncbi:MAG TPA: hypothetical protein VIL30_02855 [Ramlibacter sp.]|jgi:hypothetical protein
MTKHVPLLLMVAALASTPAVAQQANAGVLGISPTGQPGTYDLTFEPYVVKGFGRATFGMSMDEVRALIRRDYPAATSVEEEADAVARTRVINVVVPQLAPAPGPASISYVFGASSTRLAAVNVSWIAPGEATPAQREALTQAGATLVGGVSGSYWPPLSTVRGHVLAPGIVILFAGQDAAGHGIEIRLDGVPLLVQRASGTATPRPPERIAAPPGSARLRLAVVENAKRPDVFRLPAGSF